MRRFVRSPKLANLFQQHTSKPRLAFGLSPYHRRLRYEAIEVRTLLSVTPLNVALISDAVTQAQQVRAAAASGTIAIVYHADTMTANGLVDLLASVSEAHSNVPIGNLAIVAHGSSGEIDLSKADDLSLATLPGQVAAVERLRSVLTNDACLELYSCSVAAGVDGKTFVDELAADTGATVSASDHPIGTVPGADFNLNYHAGHPSVSTELFRNEDIKAIWGLCLFSSPTTTTLSDPTNPSAAGQTVTFTATVEPQMGGVGAPSGNVTFEDNGVPMPGNSTVQVNEIGITDDSAASFSISTLAVGTHSITAVYNGGTNSWGTTFYGSTAAADSHVINKYSSTTNLADPTNPSVGGQSVTFTATVMRNPPGSGTPTGTVTFEDNGVAMSGNSTVTLASGTASFSISTLSVLTGHSITAIYSGDTTFATSTSTADSHVVKDPTTTTVADPTNPSAVGQSVTFTATVIPVYGGMGVPSGTVTFEDNGVVLPGNSTVSVSAVGVSSTASFSISTLVAGSHSINAVYNGDTSFGGSPSSPPCQ